MTDKADTNYIVNNATNIIQSVAEIRKIIDQHSEEKIPPSSIKDIRSLSHKIGIDADCIISKTEE